MDRTFWIPLVGAALFLMPLLGSAVASSFPTIEPRPLTSKEAMAVVSPLPLNLETLEFNSNSATASQSATERRNSDAPVDFAPIPTHNAYLPAQEADQEPEPSYEVPPTYQVEAGWRAEAIRIACSHIGTAYVWGGERPGGFDCSGFVQYVMGSVGVQLPRTAREMYYTVPGIDAGDLKPGDLIFFRNPDHVGIYLGNGDFIHASSGRHRVAISSLYSPFYARRYIGSGRVAS